MHKRRIAVWRIWTGIISYEARNHVPPAAVLQQAPGQGGRPFVSWALGRRASVGGQLTPRVCSESLPGKALVNGAGRAGSCCDSTRISRSHRGPRGPFHPVGDPGLRTAEGGWSPAEPCTGLGLQGDEEGPRLPGSLSGRDPTQCCAASRGGAEATRVRGGTRPGESQSRVRPPVSAAVTASAQRALRGGVTDLSRSDTVSHAESPSPPAG